MNFNFKDHGVSYSEKSDFHAYMVLVDLGDTFDIMALLAHNDVEARQLAESSGGEVITVVSICGMLSAIQKQMNKPVRILPKVDPILIPIDKPDLIV